MTEPRNPLEVIQLQAGGTYSVFFCPDDVEPLAAAIEKAGHPLNGYTVEAVLSHLSEKGSPEWAQDLNFDSENDIFCVRSRRKLPLRRLVQRLQRRLDDPKAMRRLVRSVPNSLWE
jgi:hypothetical protein